MCRRPVDSAAVSGFQTRPAGTAAVYLRPDLQEHCPTSRPVGPGTIPTLRTRLGGNRVYKKVEDISDPQNPAIVSEQNFLVDINSQLPVVLGQVDTASGSLITSYVYADAQVLCQRHHEPVDPNFYDVSYYVHDRLGSVRLVVVPEYDEQTQTWAVRAANSYTYTPFGSFYDGQCIENVANPWKFTGQWHDEEIDQYHLRARQYDPAMMRFI
ncbi:MAG TPA: hypothetical protein ENN97_10335, partial [Phycisphaerales bacterium]|nr:hypothetical protein [Phycisphaerales bacterium]